jgi:hypothetical protein
MPAKSKAQFRFMKAIESGALKKKGLSKKEAKEYTEDSNYSKLPEKIKAKKKALKKLSSY